MRGRPPAGGWVYGLDASRPEPVDNLARVLCQPLSRRTYTASLTAVTALHQASAPAPGGHGALHHLYGVQLGEETQPFPLGRELGRRDGAPMVSSGGTPQACP